jgi:TolB-like protein
MANIVRFECYELDLGSGELYKHGVRVRLRDKSVVLLSALVEHPGKLVTRDDLCRRLWHDDVFVDFDNNLNTVLGRLREALNDSAEHPRFIETLPKRGYRFIAEVLPVASPSEDVVPRRARLLVLPFLNLSGDPGEEYFCDEITDEVITAIAALSAKNLGVIARTTAMHYKGSRKDVEQIGHEVAVDYVVEGGVRRAEGRIAINIQLIQVMDQMHLFARKYDAGTGDIFQLQSDIAQNIAAHIPGVAGKLAPRVQAVGGCMTRPTKNLVA